LHKMVDYIFSFLAYRSWLVAAFLLLSQTCVHLSMTKQINFSINDMFVSGSVLKLSSKLIVSLIVETCLQHNVKITTS
jgi:hypothetical protein